MLARRQVEGADRDQGEELQRCERTDDEGRDTPRKLG
jgi:hypothetical protein